MLLLSIWYINVTETIGYSDYLFSLSQMPVMNKHTLFSFAKQWLILQMLCFEGWLTDYYMEYIYKISTK